MRATKSAGVRSRGGPGRRAASLTAGSLPNHRFLAVLLTAGAMALAGCSTIGTRTTASAAHPGAPSAAASRTRISSDPASSLPAASSGAPASSSAPTAASPPPAPSTAPPTTQPPPVEQPGWTVVYETPKAIVVDERAISTADGSTITLLRFHAGLTSFDLHVGSQDPPSYGIALPASAGYVVAAAERPQLLAAFNGGFKVSTGSGGVEVAGHVLSPLRAGYASLVIDANGTAHVGVWGQGLPGPGEQVASVRQNLTPLVSGGRPNPAAGDWPAWGATLYGVSNVARSALGEDAQGNIIFAASMHALPSDLATALVDAGAQTAMELDINPYWVQADVASQPGGGLVAAVPGQQRPADQYLSGWTRDFVTVLSTGKG